MKKIFTLIAVLLTFLAISQTPNWVLFDHNNAPFTNDSITWIEVDRNNVKWVGTGNGLYSFNNNTWTVYNTMNSNIPSNVIDQFKIAYDNTIWFVNNGNGFYKFQNNAFTFYNQSNLPALYTQNFTGLTVDSNDVFLWSNTEGVVKFNSSTNSIYNINTSNSYLQNIDRLVAHGNHLIYGVCKNVLPNMSPQSFSDSVDCLNDFVIHNASSITINYYFNNTFFYGNYFNVMTDHYGYRYEMVQLYTGNPSVNQRLRTYNVNNVLLSDITYNQQPDKQMAQNIHGKYKLDNNGMNGLSVTIYNPPSNNSYNMMNSIIPSLNITNFDIDTLNNLWLATPKGLVAYNDMGVVTHLTKEKSKTISFFPNPVNNELNFKCENCLVEKVEMKLFDTHGKQVLDYQTQFLHNKSNKIDLSDFINGIYYLETKTESNMYHEKIIIQK